MENRLFNHFETLGAMSDFHPMQVEKFRIACKKAVDENTDLDFGGLCIACKIYLNFIRDFPDLTL